MFTEEQVGFPIDHLTVHNKARVITVVCDRELRPQTLQRQNVRQCTWVKPNIISETSDRSFFGDSHCTSIGLELAWRRAGVNRSDHGSITEDVHGGLTVKENNTPERQVALIR